MNVKNIIATKFPMIIAENCVSGNQAVYKLPKSVVEAILECV